MKRVVGTRWISAAIAAVAAAMVAGCTAQGASESTLNTLETDKRRCSSNWPR